MLKMDKLKQDGSPREFGRTGYSYAVIAWFGLIPFIFMFIVPLVLYGGKLNIRTADGVYRLETGDLFYALLVFGAWLMVVIIFAGLGIKLFPKKREAIYWPRARLESVFLYLSILGGAAFLVHQFLIFPSAIENFVHLASMTAYWAMGLGLCLVFGSRQGVRGALGYQLFLTTILFLILTLIPIALGKASSVASAGVVIIAALYIVSARTSTKVVAILLAGVLVVLGMTVKTSLRQILHEGGVYQRQEAISYLLNKPRAEVVHKLCSFGIVHVDDNTLIKCAGAMADSLENDMNAFSAYDQNLSNIILSRGILGEHLYFSIARVVHRLNHLGLLGHVIISTPGVVPSWGGITYKSLLFLAIPRAVWLDKPSVGVANLFGRQYRLLMPDDKVTTVNVDPVTESWMNGGWFAVLLSSAAIGLLFGSILGWLSSGGNQHIRLLAALTVVLHVALFESETALMIGGLVQGLLFLGIIVMVTRLLSSGYHFLFPARAS